MITTDAWVLHAGPAASGTGHPARAELSREIFSFEDADADEVLVEPLYGSWEANIDHALSRLPIDVCRARSEDPVILGNGAVVRVLRPGAEVTSCREGDACIVLPFGKRDRQGYAELVYGYDAPGTIGFMTKRTKLAGHMLLPLAENTAHSFAAWAAAYCRYFTAWDNWQAAYRCWMIQNEGCDPAQELVFAWGGGVAIAELQLAKRAGFRTAMTVSSDWRMANAASYGITPIDRRRFSDLYYSEQDAGEDAGYRARYRAAEQQFTEVINELSGGSGAAIIIDNIGAPLYRAAMKALSRRGVLATVGWKHGMRIMNIRANACIQRHMYVNTHVWRYDDSPVIRDLMETTSLLPGTDPESLYDFDGIPRLADEYAAARIRSYFPVYQVSSA